MEPVPANEADEVVAVEEQETDWTPPPGQPLRIIISLGALAAAVVLYAYVLLNFWFSPSLGLHQRIPYLAYLLLGASLVSAIVSFGIGLGIWSPHAKLAIAGFGFLASVVIGVGAGRFVSYTLRATLNPPFTLKLKPGDRFPDFALIDQNGVIRRMADLRGRWGALIVVYRGDFCPFARLELQELNARAADFSRAGIALIAISTDPIERSKRLGGFLHTSIPLLDDSHESLLGPLGLIQHHRNGDPDNAIPAFFLIDRDGVVRWIFTSRYYREQPAPDTILRAAMSAER
ncbi:MAG TPA: peroxiredoxin family protein [Candidatus Binataceae bacterium]|nr:peroxiredoxin family protein [Candidatus Binataceae bacterium]